MSDGVGGPRQAMPAPPLVQAILRLGAATTLVVLAFSVVQPVLAVVLQQRGYSASAIGVFASLPFLTIALMLPALPRVFAWLGVPSAYRLGLGLEALCMAGYAFGRSYELWCACSVLGSIGAAVMWNATEAMIAFNAPVSQRGRVTGLYQTALGAALAVGPFMPALWAWAWPGADAFSLVRVAPLGFVLSAGLASRRVLQRLQVDAGAREHRSLWQAMRSAPALVLLACVGGVFEAGLGSIGAAHAASLGLSTALATSLAGTLGAGSFLMQYPAGWLADRWPARRVFSAASLLLVVASIGVAGSVGEVSLLWLCAFVWGAVGGALYTLCIVRASHRFEAGSAMSGVAAMIAGYTVGAALGPVVSGIALDGLGIGGLAAWLAALALLAFVVAWRADPARL